MAEITITNSQGAMMRSNFSTPMAWNTSHDLTTAGAIDTNNNSGTAFTVGVSFSGYGGGTYSIYRFYSDFDLSGIPSGATINSAKLKLYGASSTSPHSSVTVAETDFIILQGTFTDGSTLATSMYDEFSGFTSGWDGTDSGIIEYSGEEASSWDDDAYNEITLNSTAIGDIENRAGGSTRLAMVIMNHDHDYHDNPDGENGNSVDINNDYFKINFNMEPAGSNPPQLVVDYTEAAKTTGPFKIEAGAKVKVLSGKFKVGTI